MTRARLALAAGLLAVTVPAGRPGPQPARLIPPLELEVVGMERGRPRDTRTSSAWSPASSSTTSTTRRPSSDIRPKAFSPNVTPRTFPVRVTCYGPPQFPAGQHTATRRPVGDGSLAVDPRLIPLGSTVTLAGLGTFTADDTGGAIRGPHVDVWRPSCAGWPNPTVLATIG